MKTLHLTLKREWFDMILSGQKKEEYREVKPFWIMRLMSTYIVGLDNNVNGIFKKFDTITFTNGYSKNARKIIIKCRGIYIGDGFSGWGAPAHSCFIIKLGKIIKTFNL